MISMELVPGKRTFGISIFAAEGSAGAEGTDAGREKAGWPEGLRPVAGRDADLAADLDDGGNGGP
jgi:hypothetical protein